MTYLVDFIVSLTAFTKTTSSPDESLDFANVEMLLNKDLMHTRLPDSLRWAAEPVAGEGRTTYLKERADYTLF